MGRANLEGMLEYVDRDIALEWHMRSNHFPPIHLDFKPSFLEAIEACQDEDYDRSITMPNGVTRTAEYIVRGAHLESFLVDEDEYGPDEPPDPEEE